MTLLPDWGHAGFDIFVESHDDKVLFA